MALLERENEIMKIVGAFIEEKVEFVVVGGYAVSGLAKHRFSVDCDIVISKASLKDVTNLLEAHELVDDRV
ncbi:MAG: hypothetical protein ACTSQ8_23565 [Candidatus Helarchaeota archaeon]